MNKNLSVLEKLQYNLEVLPQIQNANLIWLVGSYLSIELAISNQTNGYSSLSLMVDDPSNERYASLYADNLLSPEDSFRSFDAPNPNFFASNSYSTILTENSTILTVHPVFSFVELSIIKEGNEYINHLLEGIVNKIICKDKKFMDEQSKNILIGLLIPFGNKQTFFYKLSSKLKLKLTGREKFELVKERFNYFKPQGITFDFDQLVK